MKMLIQVILLAALISGCATGPTVQKDLANSGFAFDQAFPVTSGMANIFISRDMQLNGGGQPISVFLDKTGTSEGIPIGGSLMIRCEPGDHVLGESIGLVPPSSDEQRISVEGGHNYYWRTYVHARMISSTVTATQLSESDGQSLIKGSRFRGIDYFWSDQRMAKLHKGMGVAEVHDLLEVQPETYDWTILVKKDPGGSGVRLTEQLGNYIFEYWNKSPSTNNKPFYSKILGYDGGAVLQSWRRH